MSYDEVKAVIRDAGMAYLATVENNEPRVRAMMPALFNDGNILMATAKGTPKLSQIEKNHSVEICFVDMRMAQVRVKGKISISNDIKKKEWLSNAVPMLRSFFQTPTDPNFILLELKPDKIYLIHPGEHAYTEISK